MNSQPNRSPQISPGAFPARLIDRGQGVAGAVVVPLFRPAALFRTAAQAMLALRGNAAGLVAAPRFAGAAAMALTTRRFFPRRPPDGFGGIDPTALGRAQAAFDDIWGRLQAAIDDTATNAGLSPAQRAAAIRALRERQAAEAVAARKRIMVEATAAARVRRRMKKRQP